MSRFDDEGAPLISRSVADRWNLPIANVQRVLSLQPAMLRRQWEAQSKRRGRTEPKAGAEPLEPLKSLDAYDEHGEKVLESAEEGSEAHHLDLEG